MDNADLIPPTPKSMSDWELEQALETAKAQSDGMLSAMILLEQESQLRSEDDAVATAWIAKLRQINTPEARSALQAFLEANPRFKAEPEAAGEPLLVNQEELPEEQYVPSPVPAPMNEDTFFDDLLAQGALRQPTQS